MRHSGYTLSRDIIFVIVITPVDRGGLIVAKTLRFRRVCQERERERRRKKTIYKRAQCPRALALFSLVFYFRPLCSARLGL